MIPPGAEYRPIWCRNWDKLYFGRKLKPSPGKGRGFCELKAEIKFWKYLYYIKTPEFCITVTELCIRSRKIIIIYEYTYIK